MRTEQTEGKPDALIASHVDLPASRCDCFLSNPVVNLRIGEDCGRFLQVIWPRRRIEHDVLLPAQTPAAGKEEMRLVFRKVLGPKFFIRHVELLGVEHLHIRLPGSLHVSCPPTWIYEFPFAVVNANSVPGVVPIIWWEWRVLCQWCISEPFAVARDKDSFEASVESQVCEQLSVPLTHC